VATADCFNGKFRLRRGERKAQTYENAWLRQFELATQFTTVHHPRDYLWIPYSRSNTRISGLV
jgi:hypothetical protein